MKTNSLISNARHWLNCSVPVSYFCHSCTSLSFFSLFALLSIYLYPISIFHIRKTKPCFLNMNQFSATLLGVCTRSCWLRACFSYCYPIGGCCCLLLRCSYSFYTIWYSASSFNKFTDAILFSSLYHSIAVCFIIMMGLIGLFAVGFPKATLQQKNPQGWSQHYYWGLRACFIVPQLSEHQCYITTTPDAATAVFTVIVDSPAIVVIIVAAAVLLLYTMVLRYCHALTSHIQCSFVRFSAALYKNWEVELHVLFVLVTSAALMLALLVTLGDAAPTRFPLITACRS